MTQVVRYLHRLVQFFCINRAATMIQDMYRQVDALLEKEGCQIQCRVQIVEVYNEKVRDLLNESSPQNPEVHVHPKLGVYLKHTLDLPATGLLLRNLN